MHRPLPAKPLLCIAIPLALAACAATEDVTDEVAARTTSPANDCLTVSLADDFRPLDDRNLIVSTVGRNAYHVELSQACFGLRGNNTIALRSRTGRICGFAGDMVIVDSGITEQCSVLSVRELDEDQLQILVDQYDDDGPEGSAVDVEVAELPDDAETNDDGDDAESERTDERTDEPDAQSGGPDAQGDEPDARSDGEGPANESDEVDLEREAELERE